MLHLDSRSQANYRRYLETAQKHLNMSRIKISKPERLPREGVTDTDLNTWKNELLNYLNQDDDFELFMSSGRYAQWEAAEIIPKRLTEHKAPDTEADLQKRRKQLNNYLTIIAGVCYKDHYMTIIEQSTSLQWIWDELKNVYQITHVGKDFLNIVDIKFDPDSMTATSVYNAYRAKIMENLKPKHTVLHWKNNMCLSNNETLTPTFEDHILLSVIQLIDNRLPSKVREIYGPRMDKHKFLMDFKQDILCNVPKMIEDLNLQDAQVNSISLQQATIAQMHVNQRQHRRPKPQLKRGNNSKFCRLCHLARRPRNQVLSHEIGDINCPSLSQRDKSSLQQKLGMIATISHEEPSLRDLAAQHGYEIETSDEEEATASHQVCTKPIISYINPVPSQILTMYQKEKIVHIDIDSGSWVSCVRLEYANKMNWQIYPNDQLAKLADDKTTLRSQGEIHETLTRNNWSVLLSAIVIKDLHTDIIGGNNFLKDNNIQQNISNRNFTINNKYVVPETNRSVSLPQHLDAITIKSNINAVLLPDQVFSVEVPYINGQTLIVEPRLENNNKSWPIPQMCTVKDGKIHVNNGQSPVFLSKHHLINLRNTTAKDIQSKPNMQYKYTAMNNERPLENHINNITINFKEMTHDQTNILKQTMENFSHVFDKNLSEGYNHSSGTHLCNLNWAGEQRPISRKIACPNYNTQLNVLLQEVCDELTDQKVLGIPQQDQITIQHVSPCFLRKKQSAKNKAISDLTKSDVRLVVNTTELSKHLKNIPTKTTKPQEVYAALANWNFIIKTDLHQGFFQNHLHPKAFQWCAIQSPFGGIRYFKRSIQGLIGQTEEQDELLAKVLSNELKQSKCVKIADDIFVGGKTMQEAIDNWTDVLKKMSDNNLKLSPNKTVVFPTEVDVLSWKWKQGGYLSPSPHRKLALQKIKHEDIKTIKDLRSYLGLYKTFIDCTPNLTSTLDPLDQLTGSKESSDAITWTPQLITAFNIARDKTRSMIDLYLPRPDDQLIITCDGARSTPAVGMVLKAKTPAGIVKTVRYMSVKLKPHMIRWIPCEIEACALGTSIESFYDFIKQSNLPVIICPDSKAVVDAAKKLEKGNFSLSPRIQTFLNNLSKIKYDIQHISGKSGHNKGSDYQSRNSASCSSEICQICDFVSNTSETIIDVKLNTLKYTDDSNPNMPFLNRKAWKDIQEKDYACKQAIIALTTGQQPSKKAGKTHNTIRKYVSKATIAKDGLLVVKASIPMTTKTQEKIVIPDNFIEAIITQLHIKFQHPTKTQQNQLFNRYFYGVSSNKTIENIYDTCQICQSTKKLPTELYKHQTTTFAMHPGTHFGIDVMKRAKQKILVARDQFSSFVTAVFIVNETKNTLRDAIISVTDPIRSKGQVTIRTDNATAFKSLFNSDEQLQKLNITIELSDPNNKNGNACVDRAISEIIDELNTIVRAEIPITQADLSQALMSVNTKLRRKGKLSASEIIFARDQMSNKNLDIQDKEIQATQLEVRSRANERHNSKVNIPQQHIKPGDLVQRKEKSKKHHVKDTYLVTSMDKNTVSAKKILSAGKQFLRQQNYTFPNDKIWHIQTSTMDNFKITTQKTKKKGYAKEIQSWSPIKESVTDSESETEPESYQNFHHNIATNADNIEQNLTEISLAPQLSTTGCEISTQKSKPKEVWSTDKPPNYRPYRAAAQKAKERIMEHENLRSPSTHDNEAPISAETTRARILSDDSFNIEEPQVEWDDYEDSPSFMEKAFYNFEDYPEEVEYGRVYDFSNLPPLPLNVVSPPDVKKNYHSTPKKKTKKTNVVSKLKKRLYKQ